MVQIVSVRFNEFGKEYSFDPGVLKIEKDDKVIVETAKGLEFGTCVRGNHDVDSSVVVNPLRPVVRIANEDDVKSYNAGKEKEKEAFAYCQKKIEDFGLDMKLISVEYGFDGNKILFFFTSDGRVDFRELVKDLAAAFRARIELRQIGVRDEAKLLGGLGVCGKQFCCSQFLTDFHPVSIKMAKTQGLSLNPTKISGTCGRLMCCLKYEEAAYEDLVIKAPKIGAFVETPSGKGSVININILRRQAKVRLEDGFDTTLKTFTFDELDILGGKGRRAEYVTAKAEGRLEEAGFTPSAPAQNATPGTARNLSQSLNNTGASAGAGAGAGAGAVSGAVSGAREKVSVQSRPPLQPSKAATDSGAEDITDIDSDVEATEALNEKFAQPKEKVKFKKPHFKKNKNRKK